MKMRVLILFSVLVACVAAMPDWSLQRKVSVTWDYDQENPDMFFVYWTTNLTNQLPWPALTNAPGTNRSVTISVAPGNYFFYVTSSNFWGESGPSNTAVTPEIPKEAKSLGLKLTK